jgi:hypothetical protein
MPIFSNFQNNRLSSLGGINNEASLATSNSTETKHSKSKFKNFFKNLHSPKNPDNNIKLKSVKPSLNNQAITNNNNINNSRSNNPNLFYLTGNDVESLTESAIALFDYPAGNGDELSFFKNDLIVNVVEVIIKFFF